MPFVERVRSREEIVDDQAALVIINNFKGQITPSMNNLLVENNILVTLLLPNTTDLLQPMDLTVNKPAKDFLKRKFEEWYSEQVLQQLDGHNLDDLESTDLQPVQLGMPVMKEVCAHWLVEMAEYVSDNSQFIVSGFVRSGISLAIDGTEFSVTEDSSDVVDAENTGDSDSEESKEHSEYDEDADQEN